MKALIGLVVALILISMIPAEVNAVGIHDGIISSKGIDGYTGDTVFIKHNNDYIVLGVPAGYTYADYVVKTDTVWQQFYINHKETKTREVFLSKSQTAKLLVQENYWSSSRSAQIVNVDIYITFIGTSAYSGITGNYATVTIHVQSQGKSIGSAAVVLEGKPIDEPTRNGFTDSSGNIVFNNIATQSSTATAGYTISASATGYDSYVSKNILIKNTGTITVTLNPAGSTTKSDTNETQTAAPTINYTFLIVFIVLVVVLIAIVYNKR